jgi:hypothetical protein
MVFWLSQLQNRIRQQEALCDALLTNQRRFNGEDALDVKGSNRYSRSLNATSAPRESLEHQFEKMADLQIQSLRASCLRNEKLCIQGPKGNIGPKGEKGDQGIRGAKGNQGSKGGKGEPGNWTSSLVAPTFVVVPPKVFEASIGEKAVLKCYAVGFPPPMIAWSRTTASSRLNIAASNNTLVIEEVKMQDFGQYHFTATNPLGSIVHSFKISPTGGAGRVSTSVVAGRNVSLRCSLCSEQGYSFKWKNPKANLQSDRVHVDGCFLDIINTTTADSGSYTCLALREDDDEILRETFLLTVTDGPVNVDLEVAEKPCAGIAVDINKDAVFNCTLCRFKLPGVSFTWERAGSKIASHRAYMIDCTFVLSNVTLQDSGDYTCIATFRSSAVLRETTTLCVRGPPLIYHTSDLVISVGQSAELKCTGVGPPVPEVYWTRGSVRLSHIGMGTATLKLDHAAHNDSGEYFCHVENYLGKKVKGTKLVVTKLEFIVRPPPEIMADVSETVSIDCTASDGPGLPLAYTRWILPPSCTCGDEASEVFPNGTLVFPNGMLVLPNGTLVISETKLRDTGVYTCKAYTHAETVSTAVYLFVSSSAGCDDWMLTTDGCGGFRQSTYDSSVYYAVSASTTWDKYKYYQCPRGYHWACTEEGRRIFQSNTGVSVYSSQCGWSGYNFRGSTRYYFRFRDSAKTSAYKHAGHRDGYEVQTGYDRSSFAGVVCIKD